MGLRSVNRSGGDRFDSQELIWIFMSERIKKDILLEWQQKPNIKNKINPSLPENQCTYYRSKP
jgi:hypothetical protein